MPMDTEEHSEKHNYHQNENLQLEIAASVSTA